MKTVLNPMFDRVVVQPMESKDKIGLIYLPEQSKEKPHFGLVLSVGPGRVESGTLVPPRISAGETVLYGKHSGTEVEIDGKTVLILREMDILATVAATSE